MLGSINVDISPGIDIHIIFQRSIYTLLIFGIFGVLHRTGEVRAERGANGGSPEGRVRHSRDRQKPWLEMLKDGRLERMRLGRRALRVTCVDQGGRRRTRRSRCPPSMHKRKERSSDPQLGLALVKADKRGLAQTKRAQGGIAVVAIL